MTGERTQFDYLLNAFEHASQSDKPADNGYGEKRRALFGYVRSLESATLSIDKELLRKARDYVERIRQETINSHMNPRTGKPEPADVVDCEDELLFALNERLGDTYEGMAMPDQPKRVGCSLSALRMCQCIGRAAGPNCRFWSEDLDGDLQRSHERTAAERQVTDSRCNYIAFEFHVCNKCGCIHNGKPNPAVPFGTGGTDGR